MSTQSTQSIQTTQTIHTTHTIQTTHTIHTTEDTEKNNPLKIENTEDQSEEKLFILTESLDDGIRDILAIYAHSDMDVARYLIENANVVSMFEDRDYNNLFTYILEFIELSVGQEFADEETQDVLDNLSDYLTPQDVLNIIENSSVHEKTQAGYSLFEVPLSNIAVSYPEHIKP